jgi:hypothetical protein
MSWIENILGTGKTIEQAQAAANDVVQKIEPIVLHIEHRLFGGLHGLLTRLNGATLTLNIPPQPYPDDTSEIRKAEKL